MNGLLEALQMFLAAGGSGIRPVDEEHTVILIGQDGEVHKRTTGCKIVPYAGEINPEVAQAHFEIFAHRKEMAKNMETVATLHEQLPELWQKHAEEELLLQEKIWQQIPRLSGKFDMRVVENPKKKDEYLVKVDGETRHQFSGDAAAVLFQKSGALAALEKEISETAERQRNAIDLARGLEKGDEMRVQKAIRLLHQHHPEIADDVINCEMSDDEKSLTFRILQKVDEESGELSEKELRLIATALCGKELPPVLAKLLASVAQANEQLEPSHDAPEGYQG
jgi:anion-transporting  ArsA/GET3 family ATPase